MTNIDPQDKEVHEQMKFKKRVGETGVVTQDPGNITYFDAVGDTTYIGLADSGTSTTTAGWQIKKILVVGGVTSITFAGGSDEDDKKWSLRTTYTYS
jgi:hypothetical protein